MSEPESLAGRNCVAVVERVIEEKRRAEDSAAWLAAAETFWAKVEEKEKSEEGEGEDDDDEEEAKERQIGRINSECSVAMISRFGS
jgi:hypothetical protein